MTACTRFAKESEVEAQDHDQIVIGDVNAAVLERYIIFKENERAAMAAVSVYCEKAEGYA